MKNEGQKKKHELNGSFTNLERTYLRRKIQLF